MCPIMIQRIFKATFHQKLTLKFHRSNKKNNLTIFIHEILKQTQRTKPHKEAENKKIKKHGKGNQIKVKNQYEVPLAISI